MAVDWSPVMLNNEYLLAENNTFTILRAEMLGSHVYSSSQTLINLTVANDNFIVM